MRDLTDLAITPHRRSKSPQATRTAIARFETHFGLVLPQDYVQFLLKHNGGAPALRWFRVLDGGEDGLIGRFFFLGDAETEAAKLAEDWDHENLWAETRVRRPWIGERGVAIASNGGGDILFLDYRNNPPTISEMSGEDRSTRPIARSFSELVDSMYNKEVTRSQERRHHPERG